LGPDQPPVKVEKDPKTDRLVITLNTTSKLLDEAKAMRGKEEEPAVTFVFKYGLALAVMGLLDRQKQTDEWKTDEPGCREKVQQMAEGIARVIVPLCLPLPKNLPKKEKTRSRATPSAA